MKILFLIVACFGALVLPSCTKRLVPVQVNHTVTDTIIVKQIEVKIDTLITVKGDTLTIVDTIPCSDYSKEIVSTKNGSKIKTVIDKGILKITSTQPNTVQPITIYKKVPCSEKYRIEKIEIPKIVEIVKMKIPRWCIALLLFNIGFIIYKIKNFFNPKSI